jgi:excisionase family DNA binding protein
MDRAQATPNGGHAAGHRRLLLRVEEAAQSLSIGRSTLWELIRDGEIGVVRIGRSVRIPQADLERWIAGRVERVA